MVFRSSDIEKKIPSVLSFLILCCQINHVAKYTTAQLKKKKKAIVSWIKNLSSNFLEFIQSGYLFLGNEPTKTFQRNQL